MAGDTSQATAAKRKKIQADLMAAQAELENSYYDHSLSSREEALDKELESFRESKEKEIANWEEYLKNVDTVVADSLNYVKGQTESIYSTLTGLGQQYGLSLSENITTPWSEGSIAVDNYSTKFETACSSWTTQLDNIATHWRTVQAEAEAAAASQLRALNQQVNNTQGAGASRNPPTSNNNQPQRRLPAQQQPSLAKGSSVTVKTTATHFSRDGGRGTKMMSFVPGGTYTVYQVAGNEVLIGRNGTYTGWVYKQDLVGFSKGGIVKKDDLYNVAELGDELQIMADGNGRVSYMRTNSGVLSAPLTERLMDIATNPESLFENFKTNMKVPNIVSNNMGITMQIDKVVNIEHADSTSIPEIKKAVNDQLEAYQAKLNRALKRA